VRREGRTAGQALPLAELLSVLRRARARLAHQPRASAGGAAAERAGGQGGTGMELHLRLHRQAERCRPGRAALRRDAASPPETRSGQPGPPRQNRAGTPAKCERARCGRRVGGKGARWIPARPSAPCSPPHSPLIPFEPKGRAEWRPAGSRPAGSRDAVRLGAKQRDAGTAEQTRGGWARARQPGSARTALGVGVSEPTPWVLRGKGGGEPGAGERSHRRPRDRGRRKSIGRGDDDEGGEGCHGRGARPPLDHGWVTVSRVRVQWGSEALNIAGRGVRYNCTTRYTSTASVCAGDATHLIKIQDRFRHRWQRDERAHPRILAHAVSASAAASDCPSGFERSPRSRRFLALFVPPPANPAVPSCELRTFAAGPLSGAEQLSAGGRRPDSAAPGAGPSTSAHFGAGISSGSLVRPSAHFPSWRCGPWPQAAHMPLAAQ
jgi:hypothetical protein